MKTTDADRQLREYLDPALQQLRRGEPYVWQLRLTEQDFVGLEQRMVASLASHGGRSDHLLGPELALHALVYLALWYQRRYNGTPQVKPLLEWSSKELKQLWEAAGLDTTTYVYTSMGGKRMWQYSTYILGGLALRLELGRTDLRFLKQLCRLYYGEAGDIEQLAGDASRAIAFRESIARGHSLYHFVRALLTDEAALPTDETACEQTDAARFVARLKSANDEVMREKFSLEWVVNCAPNRDYLTRHVRLLLRPEDVGGVNHPYLRLERLHSWGFTQLDETLRLQVALRFAHGGQVVSEANFARPLLTFINTGEAESGFVAWMTSRVATHKAVTHRPFDRVEVVMRSDCGQERVVYSEEVADVMQLYRMDLADDRWCSTPNRQRQTAVWYSDEWQLATTDVVSNRLPIHTRTGDSRPWNWTYIANEVTLVHREGESRTFYNRAGYAQVQARLHTDTIAYAEGGRVKYVATDDEGEACQYLPLIYGRDDLVVAYCSEPTDEASAQREPPRIERIEFKAENQRYAEWTAEQEPDYGRVALRVTVQGEPKGLTVVYAPRIERRCEAHCIVYGDVCLEDDCSPQPLPLRPTRTLRLADATGYAEIEVYRPTLLKQVCMSGRVVWAVDDQQVVVPYALKDLLTVHDFSTKGYAKYVCRYLPNIYRQLNLQMTDAALHAWTEGREYRVKEMDTYAPDSLWMSWGDASAQRAEGQWFLWDYHEDTEPTPCAPDTVPPPCCIVFQSMRDYDGRQACLPPQRGRFMPFKYQRNRISVVKVFRVAAEHRTYFFPFQPLQKVTDMVGELYRPLLDDMGGALDDETRTNLERLAEEFGFDWAEKGVILDNDV